MKIAPRQQPFGVQRDASDPGSCQVHERRKRDEIRSVEDERGGADQKALQRLSEVSAILQPVKSVAVACFVELCRDLPRLPCIPHFSET